MSGKSPSRASPAGRTLSVYSRVPKSSRSAATFPATRPPVPPSTLPSAPKTSARGKPPLGRAQIPDLPQDDPGELDDAEMEKGERWQARENPTRAAIIETIALSLRSSIRDAWSAFDCFNLLKHKVTSSSTDHKRAAKAKVTNLRLSDNRTPEEMRAHLDTFRDLVHKSKQVGLTWSNFNLCDIFLASLPPHTNEPLHLKWDTACKVLGVEEDFVALTVYITFTEQYRLRWEESEGAAAVPGIFGPASTNASVSGNSRHTKYKKGGKTSSIASSGKGSSNSSGKTHNGTSNTDDVPICTYCRVRYHTEKDCHSREAGLPSAAERRERLAAVRKKHSKSRPPNNRAKITKVAAITSDSSSRQCWACQKTTSRKVPGRRTRRGRRRSTGRSSTSTSQGASLRHGAATNTPSS